MKTILSRILAIYTFFVLPIASTLSAPVANITVYDLNTDWSDAVNPNGAWSYREGGNALPHVVNWGSLTPAQPAWARSVAPPSKNYIPTWFKATAAIGTNIQTGDVIVHTTDPYNGVGNGLSNVVWTSPFNSIINVSGAVWEVGITSTRSNHWILSLNGTQLTTGDINTTNSSRSSQFNLSSGIGGPAALSGIAVKSGDVLKLEFNATTPGGATLVGTGDEVGVKLTVTATRSVRRDLNGDAKTDLVFQNNAGQLYQWFLDGTGRAVTFSPKAGIINFGYLYTGGLGDWRVVAVADVNGDGIPDLVFQNGVGQIYAWFLDGTGNAVNFSTGAGLKGSRYLYTGGLGDWRVMGVADVNGDGNPDLVFQNGVGQVYAWFLDGTGTAVNFSTGAGLTPGSKYLYTAGLGDWRVVGVSDVNGDGNPDLIFQNTAGQIYAWFLNGSGVAANFGTGAGLVPGSKYLYTGGLADWRVAGIMDVNGDNIPDLVFQNNAGQLYAWFLNGSGAAINFGTGVGLVGSVFLYTGGLADWRVR